MEPTDFLQELRWRGLLHQVTDLETAQNALKQPGCVAYIGFDPTADSLHVGSLLQIVTLMRFKLAGHQPIALIGGGTGLIGDPSGKTAERKLLDDASAQQNAQAIRQQILEITQKNQVDIDFSDNLEWLGPAQLIPFLRDVGKFFSVNAMVQRDSVRTRLEAREQGISYTEFSYMLLQAYDFLELYRRRQCRAQLGGSDQWGNIVSGVDLIGRLETDAVEKPAFGVTIPLITSKSGQKFGKTEAGTIWLDPKRTSPYQFYQFWMNVDDADVLAYLKFFTFFTETKIAEFSQRLAAQPELRECQVQLAHTVTALVHGEKAAGLAGVASKILFGMDPNGAHVGVFDELLRFELPTHQTTKDAPLLAILVGENRPFLSNGEAKRGLQSGAVSVNGQKRRLEDLHEPIDWLHDRFALIKFGKKFFLADAGA